MKNNPVNDRIRAVRRAIRRTKPLNERIELVRKMDSKMKRSKPIQLKVEQDENNQINVRINEES